MVSLGAISQQDDAAGATSGSGSEPGVVSLDFVNDAYTGPSGETLALADVIDLTARRSASGLECTATTPVQLIGAWRDLLLAEEDWSAVIEFVPSSSAGTSGRSIFLFTLGNSDFTTQVAIYTAGNSGDVISQFFEDNGAGDDRFAENVFAGTPLDTLRIAAARSDTNFAISMGGEAAVTDANTVTMASWTFAPTKIELASGNLSGINGSYIRSIDFSVPGISNSALATRSA
jgi:hypothetical protein